LIDAGSVAGGVGGANSKVGNGQAFATGIYLGGDNTLKGNTTLTFAPSGTLKVAGVIGDDMGSAAAAGYTGPAGYKMSSFGIKVDGTGTLLLTAAEQYSGGTVIKAGTLELGKNGSIGGNTVIQGGTLKVDDGGSLGGNAVIQGGMLELDSGGKITGNTVSIQAGTLELANGAAFAGNVQFTGTGATLRFDSATSQLGGIINGAVPGDNFDLHFHAFAAGDHLVWQQNDSPVGTLLLENSSGNVLGSLKLHGFYLQSMFTAMDDHQGGTLIGVQAPGGRVIPPDNGERNPITLNSGDILTVNAPGKSTDVTIQGGGTEIVNMGGYSFRTTINADAPHGQGVELVTGGTLDITTINGGKVETIGSTAIHDTILYLPGSEFHAFEHSVIKDNTTIHHGTLFLDATSTANQITFGSSPGDQGGVAVENPSSLGRIFGLAKGDFIQFGGVTASSPDVTVTKWDPATNTITYNDGQTAHLSLAQANVKFDITQGTSPSGHHFSTLTVVTVGAALATANDTLAITPTVVPRDQAAAVADSGNAGLLSQAESIQLTGVLATPSDSILVAHHV
jgi:autotransporter-associated beta strand protein/autotransporter passenger strand-loop-strand repeat protein